MSEKEWFEKKALSFGEVLFTFPVYHHMWDCDGYASLVKTPEAKTALVMSNHGRTYLADKKELEEKLKEYKALILDTEEALRLLS